MKRKRIVFDLDNTLIVWKDEYGKDWIEKSLKEFHLPYDVSLIKKIDQAVGYYETTCDIFTRAGMLEAIRTVLPVPDTFLDVGIHYLKDAAPDRVSNDIYEALAYLKEKYDLVVLTNWFCESQKGRLQKAGLLSYFSEVYGADNRPLKPHEKAFAQVARDIPYEECIMIGDDPIYDGTASQLGMEVLIYDPTGKYEDSSYKTFSNFLELMQLL